MVLEYHFHEDEVILIKENICSTIFLSISILYLDSVLQFLRDFQSNSSFIDLLCDAAYLFHSSYIAECKGINDKTKTDIYQRATTPCTLKNIARKQIRTYLFNSSRKMRIDRGVKMLDLPNFLQNYLLFENA